MSQIVTSPLKHLVLIYQKKPTWILLGGTAAGSQAATAIRGEKVREKTGAQIAIDNALYELPDNTDLELGDSVLEKMLKIFFRLTT